MISKASALVVERELRELAVVAAVLPGPARWPPEHPDASKALAPEAQMA